MAKSKPKKLSPAEYSRQLRAMRMKFIAAKQIDETITTGVKKPSKKKPKIVNEDKAKKFILQELKVADEMRKASKQLLGMNTSRPEVLRRAKRYAKLSNELSMRADRKLKDLRGTQKARDRYSKRYGDM